MGLYLPRSNYRNSSGQALLIVLLAMSVVLSLVLSAVSRSVTDIAITSIEEDSSRAFAAAESGVERFLTSDTTTTVSGTLDNGANFQAVPVIPNPSTNFAYPKNLTGGESATFWFVEHASNGSLTCSGGTCSGGATNVNNIEVCWGRGVAGNTASTPALELAIYYDPTRINAIASPTNNFSTLQIERYAYDPNTSRANNFASTTSCSDSSYSFSTGSINLVSTLGNTCVQNPGCLITARARLLYNGTTPHPIMLHTIPGTIPAQGVLISSTGEAGDTTRKVEVFQSYPSIPDVFDVSLFSRTNIVHF